MVATMAERPRETEDDEPALEPSEVDELTHAELLCLYQDAEMNIRFAKLMQWCLTGSVILIFVMLVFLGANQERGGVKLNLTLAVITQIATPLAIYVLAILQSWQKTERQKIRTVLEHLSSLARDVYGTKSRMMANIERYVLLACMVLTILTGAGLTLARLPGWV
jgi:hypothetical protein